MHEVGVLQIHCRPMCWSQKQRELVRECRAGGGNTDALQPAPSNHCQQGRANSGGACQWQWWWGVVVVVHEQAPAKVLAPTSGAWDG